MIRRVAIAVSGGVDSAVAAYVLKQKGYDLHGIYMKNWDVMDEHGTCSSDTEYHDAQMACDILGIPLMQVNFVKEYWNEVFLNFVDDYEHGFTPNPDVLCNKYVKFHYFYKYAREVLKCDAIATGHYANSSFGRFLETSDDGGTQARLLRAADISKDQTFFLSQISQDALRRTMFPLGDMLKRDVKALAAAVGLAQFATKKESMGICFIGARNFQRFIQEYVADRPGDFIDVDTGQCVGKHNGIHQWTIGQRAKLSGYAHSYYVAKKCCQTGRIYVAPGFKHPALYSALFFTSKPHWIAPCAHTNQAYFECDFKFQHIHDSSRCTLMQTNRGLIVMLDTLKRALAPGQYAVFYRHDECLGSARILSANITQFSLAWLMHNRTSSMCSKHDAISYEGNKFQMLPHAFVPNACC